VFCMTTGVRRSKIFGSVVVVVFVDVVRVWTLPDQIIAEIARPG
jgi:hypothetical protein